MLVCTPEHRILTTSGWCEARALTQGQRVVLGIEGPLYDPTEDELDHLAAFELQFQLTTTTATTLQMRRPADVARAHAFARILGSLYMDGSTSHNEENNSYSGSLHLAHRIDADQAVKDLKLVLGETCKVHNPTTQHNCYRVRSELE